MSEASVVYDGRKHRVEDRKISGRLLQVKNLPRIGVAKPSHREAFSSEMTAMQSSGYLRRSSWRARKLTRYKKRDERASSLVPAA